MKFWFLVRIKYSNNFLWRTSPDHGARNVTRAQIQGLVHRVTPTGHAPDKSNQAAWERGAGGKEEGWAGDNSSHRKEKKYATKNCNAIVTRV